jgi:hypothetical protein
VRQRSNARVQVLILGAALSVLMIGCSSGSPTATFDGQTCDFDGPDKVSAGGVEMTLTNTSGEFVALAFLELPGNEERRAQALALVGSDFAIPPEEDPDGAQVVGFLMAEPGEEVVEEAALPSGSYVVDCATFDGERPSHAWRAAVLEVE